MVVSLVVVINFYKDKILSKFSLWFNILSFSCWF